MLEAWQGSTCTPPPTLPHCMPCMAACGKCSMAEAVRLCTSSELELELLCAPANGGFSQTYSPVVSLAGLWLFLHLTASLL